MADNPTTPDHLTPKVTERGFQHLPPIPGSYGGSASVYEPSAAEHACIWLNVSKAPDTTGDATLHLPIEQAEQLAEQIMFLVEHHYQRSVDA